MALAARATSVTHLIEVSPGSLDEDGEEKKEKKEVGAPWRHLVGLRVPWWHGIAHQHGGGLHKEEGL